MNTKIKALFLTGAFVLLVAWLFSFSAVAAASGAVSGAVSDGQNMIHASVVQEIVDDCERSGGQIDGGWASRIPIVGMAADPIVKGRKYKRRAAAITACIQGRIAALSAEAEREAELAVSRNATALSELKADCRVYACRSDDWYRLCDERLDGPAIPCDGQLGIPPVGKLHRE